MIKMEKAQGLLKWWSGDVSHEAHGDYRPAARRAATAALAGDTAAGEKIFKAQCGICHAVAAGENRIGPTLFGVVGRPAQRNDAMCQNPKSTPRLSR
jgi:cytochrome c2